MRPGLGPCGRPEDQEVHTPRRRVGRDRPVATAGLPRPRSGQPRGMPGGGEGARGPLATSSGTSSFSRAASQAGVSAYGGELIPEMAKRTPTISPAGCGPRSRKFEHARAALERARALQRPRLPGPRAPRRHSTTSSCSRAAAHAGAPAVRRARAWESHDVIRPGRYGDHLVRRPARRHAPRSLLRRERMTSGRDWWRGDQPTLRRRRTSVASTASTASAGSTRAPGR